MVQTITCVESHPITGPFRSANSLARERGTELATIQRLEKGQNVVAAHVSTVIKLQSALEKAGIRFLPQDEAGGIGIRFKR